MRMPGCNGRYIPNVKALTTKSQRCRARAQDFRPVSGFTKDAIAEAPLLKNPLCALRAVNINIPRFIEAIRGE